MNKIYFINSQVKFKVIIIKKKHMLPIINKVKEKKNYNKMKE